MAYDESSISSPVTQAFRKLRRPTKPCDFEGCDKWAWARGYCDNHYQKLKREGVIKSIRIVGDLNARFDASYEINPVSGCWEWTGWIHPKGYGVLPVGSDNKKIRAHRLSYERFVGPIPAGLFVLHRCDNRRCCCPQHLFLGDNAANQQDCVAKGRHNSQRGTYRRKITPAMALNIRIMYARGNHSMQGLANIYGVEHGTISGIVRGRFHLA